MLNLYTPFITKISSSGGITDSEKLSIAYHNIFDYPLNFAELIKWKAGELAINYQSLIIRQKRGLIYQRLMRKKISEKKMLIAKKASKIISLR